MLKRLKDIKFYGLVYSIASAFFIMVISVPFFYEESLFSRLFDAGVDTMGALICAALYYGCMKQEGDGSRIFRTLVVLVCSCFTVNELTIYMLTPRPEQTALGSEQVLIGFVLCMLSKLLDLAMIYLFYLYVKDTLGFEGKFAKVVDRFLPVLLVVQLLIQLSNVFWPVSFYVDAGTVVEGTFEAYHVTDFSMLEDIFLGLASLLTTILIFMSKNPFHQEAAVLTFIFLPLVEYVFLGGNFGEASQYGIVLMSLIVMYCVIFNFKSSKLAATETELNMATEIQMSMLPLTFPAFPDRPEFDIHASMDPAKEVGGDFYDFFLIDDDHLALVIADVSGKGVPAALFMMSSKIYINDHATMGGTPAEILERVNKLVCANNKAHMFVTVWLGILEISTGKLTSASAGHEYPIINVNGKYELFKDRHGLAVGAMSIATYTDTEIRLKPGDSIFVYTDGVAEATDANNQMFGTDRTVEALNAAPAGCAQKDVLSGVRAAVDAFVKEAPQFDDLTMLGLRYNGPKKNDAAEEV